MYRSAKTVSPFVKRLGGGIGVAVLPIAAVGALLFPATATATATATAAPAIVDSASAMTQVNPADTSEVHRSFEFGNESKYTLKVTRVMQDVEGSLLNPPSFGDTFAPGAQYEPDVVFHAVKGADARIFFDAFDSDGHWAGGVKMGVGESAWGVPSFYGATTLKDAHIVTSDTWIVIRDN